MLTNEQKSAVSKAIKAWKAENPELNTERELARLTNINIAYVNNIANGVYSQGKTVYADRYFAALAAVVGVSLKGADEPDFHWQTPGFELIQRVCQRAQQTGKRILLDGDSGLGKSYALTWYASRNPRVIYVRCTSSMSKRELLNALLKPLGLDGKVKGEMNQMNAIEEKISEGGWLLIIDEAEDVKSALYKAIKELEDLSKGKAGLVVCGLGLEEKLNRLALRKKDGFRQLKRRLFPNLVHTPVYSHQVAEQALAKISCQDPEVGKWFKRNVDNYDMLSEFVKDLYNCATRTGLPVNIDMVNKLFYNAG